MNLWSFSLKLPSGWDSRTMPPDSAWIQSLYIRQDPIIFISSTPSLLQPHLPHCCSSDVLSILPSPGCFNSFWTSGMALEGFSSNGTVYEDSLPIPLLYQSKYSFATQQVFITASLTRWFQFLEIRSCIFSMPRTGSGMKYVLEKYLLNEIQIISAKTQIHKHCRTEPLHHVSSTSWLKQF